MASDYIINVNEMTFEYEVLAFSQNTPVLVDFWATWCRPCRTLSPLLERYAAESAGKFRLAKVDVDHNPNLALMYNVRSVPTVKAFSHGAVVDEFVGIVPELKIRELISRLAQINTSNLTLERANNLLLDRDWLNADKSFREYLLNDPTQPVALLGLMKTQLAQGNADDALKIWRNFPYSKEYSSAEMLLPYAQSIKRLEHHTLPQETDQDTAFANCIRLAKIGNIPAALDGLLDIIRLDRTYRENLAKSVFLALLEIMGGEDPEIRRYRNELAAILF